MRQLTAILGDSLREAIDRRSLLVLLVLSLIPITFCFGLSFDRESLEQVLERQLGDIRRVSSGRFAMARPLEQETLSLGPVPADAGWPAELDGGLVANLRFPDPTQLDAIVAAWREAREPSEAPEPGSPRSDFLEQRFHSFGWDEVAVRPGSGDPRVMEIAVRCQDPAQLQGAFGASILFGAFEIPLRGVSVAVAVTMLQTMLASGFVGFIGLLVGLLSCAAFVPNMLQKGTLDLVLARPISRPTLLIGKYLGGLWYVALIATFLIGGCWAGLAVGSGYASPAFLITIPSLLLAFAALHAVSVFVGVLTRSSGVASLLACAVWGASVAVANVRAFAQTAPAGESLQIPARIQSLLDGAWLVLPKIKDIDALNLELLASANRASDALQRAEAPQLLATEPLTIVGTTLGFTVVVLALASLVFQRRDC